MTMTTNGYGPDPWLEPLKLRRPVRPQPPVATPKEVKEAMEKTNTVTSATALPYKGVWVVYDDDSCYGVFRTAEDAVTEHGDDGYSRIKFFEWGEHIL